MRERKFTITTVEESLISNNFPKKVQIKVSRSKNVKSLEMQNYGIEWPNLVDDIDFVHDDHALA